MANSSGSLAGDLPDPSKPGPGVGQGSLSGYLPDPSEAPQAIPAQVPPAQPHNPTMDTATGPDVRMEVDLPTVKAVVKGYEEDIATLRTALRQVRRIERIDNPGEEEASYTYVSDHRTPTQSLRESIQSHVDQLEAHRHNLTAAVRQYEGTEATNTDDLGRPQ